MGAVTTRQGYRMVDALNAEWLCLGADREAVTGWAGRHAALANCRSVDEVLAAVRQDPDVVLSALLVETRGGDQLAGRVVLQAMLGKVVRMAQCDPQGTTDDYVAALWCRIRCYPTARRPVKIAANLALDTLKSVLAERRWVNQEAIVALVGDEELLDQMCTDSEARAQLDHAADASTIGAAQLLRTARRLRLIDEPTQDVLLTVYADGASGAAAAQKHATSPAMVRYRCSRAVRRLAQQTAALTEAA